MKNWIKKQLTEPTAWLCFVLIAVLIFTRSDTIALVLCVIGILMDEDAMKAWCAKVAPGLSKKIDEIG